MSRAFRRVLVANRGEIALRVIRACHARGVEAIQAYSEADRDSLPVRSADGAICIGPVFLTDLPKSRGNKPKQYDYVIIEGYPAGQFTYHSVGTVQHTVRRFSAQLVKAVELNLQPTNQPAAAVR